MLEESQVQQLLIHVTERFPLGSIYGNVRGVIPVSCTKRIGIPELHEKISEIAHKHSMVNQRVPAFYLNLKDVVHRLRSEKKYAETISYPDFKRAADEIITKQTEFQAAVRFLHDSGILIHFNIARSKLKDLVILDPQWLANVMSSVVTFRHNWLKEGFIYLDNIANMWTQYPKDLWDSLLQLLEKFGVR
jgi:leucine-rich repeat kinase 2